MPVDVLGSKVDKELEFRCKSDIRNFITLARCILELLCSRALSLSLSFSFCLPFDGFCPNIYILIVKAIFYTVILLFSALFDIVFTHRYAKCHNFRNVFLSDSLMSKTWRLLNIRMSILLGLQFFPFTSYTKM